jgi:hypothetical protein
VVDCCGEQCCCVSSLVVVTFLFVSLARVVPLRGNDDDFSPPNVRAAAELQRRTASGSSSLFLLHLEVLFCGVFIVDK